MKRTMFYSIFLSFALFLSRSLGIILNWLWILIPFPSRSLSLCPRRKNVPDYGASREKKDLGFLTFDLKADLTSLFNWNVKELFLYLTAEYKTKDNELNQVVLWDKILLRGENALLDYQNLNTKYYFWDDGNGLKWVFHDYFLFQLFNCHWNY